MKGAVVSMRVYELVGSVTGYGQRLGVLVDMKDAVVFYEDIGCSWGCYRVWAEVGVLVGMKGAVVSMRVYELVGGVTGCGQRLGF